MESVSKADLPVAVDAMGGDLGPLVVVQGAVEAARSLKRSSILVGDEAQIREALKKLNAGDEPLLQVVHASEVITMDDSPVSAVRRKENSSVRVAFDQVLKGKACAVVSSGNTGAVMAAGLIMVGPMPGVVRPAIATLIPRIGQVPPTILVDSGANVDCNAAQLVQFAMMGSLYAECVGKRSKPRVALLSNGSEITKGTDLTRSAALSLSRVEGLNFVGYVEGRDIPRDKADVVVCDGFVGNVLLKTMEGCVELVFDTIKSCVERSLFGKIGIWLAKPVLKQVFYERLDPAAYGGAPLLGLNEIAIICHGASNSRAIMNGIRVAHDFVKADLAGKMLGELAKLESSSPGDFEDGMWGRVGQQIGDVGRKA